MKKTTWLIMLMVVAALVLAACDAAIPGAEPESSDSEESMTDVAPDAAEVPEETEEIAEPGAEESVAEGGRIVTAWIGPELIDCVGVAPQKCMQVKTNPDDDYGLFYDQIEGFEFEEGNEYELQVLVEPVQDPPQDASALKFTLVEVISMTPVDGAGAQEAVGEVPADAEEALTLEGPTWLLETYVDLAGQPTESLPDTRVTATFADGEVNGSAGCNNYFGPYQVDGSSLTAGPLGSTMMACFLEEVVLQETAYLANLGNVAGYEIVENQLHLRDADGQTILIYSEDEQLSLTGTVWSVTGYNNGTGGVTSVVIDTEMTAVFAEVGIVGGSAGCNNYRAAYETDDLNISIGPAAVTRKMCAAPEGVMEQESLYLAALEMAATYEIVGPRMDMYDESGSRVATFNAAASVEEVIEENVDLPVVAAEDGSEESAGSGNVRTIYVGPEMVDCEGEGPQTCLVVSEAPDGESQLWYFPIEGFEFEPGYEYELIVRQEDVENPPPGSSSIKWTLMEEVSKTPVEGTDNATESIETEQSAAAADSLDLAGTRWQWLQMVTPLETVAPEDPAQYLVEFMADGAIGILADCNSGNGTYEASGGSISINITNTTLALCAEDSLSDLFIRSLNAAAIYFDQSGNLFMDLMADGGTMEFAPN